MTTMTPNEFVDAVTTTPQHEHFVYFTGELGIHARAHKSVRDLQEIALIHGTDVGQMIRRPKDHLTTGVPLGLGTVYLVQKTVDGTHEYRAYKR